MNFPIMRLLAAALCATGVLSVPLLPEARGALVLDGASSFPYLLQSVKDSAYCIHPDGGRATQNAELLFWNDCDATRPDLLFISLDAGDGKFVLQSCTSAPTWP